jgi:uncharacterized protein YkwD
MKHIILFLFLTSFTYSFSQEKSNIQLEILKTKLTNIINNHRKSLKLKELSEDINIQKAAKNQSNYLLLKRKLTHEQDDIKLKTPMDRVEFYAGKKFSLVGENVLSKSIENKKYSDNDLDRLANQLFQQWKNSPGHYKNMIHKEYDTGEIEFAIDYKINRLFATQVFGLKGIEIPNQLSENAFDLNYRNDKCKTISFSIKQTIGNSIQIEGKDVILYYHDFEKFKTIFSDKNDGIAIDFVEKEQMDCGKSNSFDISPIYDGILAKPIYRDELIANNSAENTYKIITKVGTVPDFLIGKDIIANVVLIFDNCACEYVIPLEAKSKSIELFEIEPIITIPKNTSLTNKGLISTEEIIFEFDKKNIIPKQEYYYNYENETIHSYQIYSYSSIEGNEVLNKKLHEERAIALEKYANDTLKISKKPSLIIAEENWEKCFIQLAMENKDDLISKSKKDIRKYINDNSNEWNEYLNEQRVSKISVNIYGEIDLTKKDYGEIDINKIYYELNLRTAIFEMDINKANLALSKLYQNEYSYILFEDLIFNKLLTDKNLVQNAAAVLTKNYKYDYFKTIHFLKTWLTKFESLSKDTQLNLLILYCKLNKELLEKWDVSITKLTNVNKPNSLEDKFKLFPENKKLQSNFAYILLYYSNHINDYDKINLYFDNVYKSFKENIKTKEDRINLALFLNHWSVYSYSIDLLLPQINKPTFSKEEALLLAQTSTLVSQEEDFKELSLILKKVYQLNQKEWCTWQNENFNLLRNQKIKEEYCKKCQ